MWSRLRKKCTESALLLPLRQRPKNHLLLKEEEEKETNFVENTNSAQLNVVDLENNRSLIAICSLELVIPKSNRSNEIIFRYRTH